MILWSTHTFMHVCVHTTILVWDARTKCHRTTHRDSTTLKVISPKVSAELSSGGTMGERAPPHCVLVEKGKEEREGQAQGDGAGKGERWRGQR